MRRRRRRRSGRRCRHPLRRSPSGRRPAAAACRPTGRAVGSRRSAGRGRRRTQPSDHVRRRGTRRAGASTRSAMVLRLVGADPGIVSTGYCRSSEACPVVARQGVPCRPGPCGDRQSAGIASRSAVTCSMRSWAAEIFSRHSVMSVEARATRSARWSTSTSDPSSSRRIESSSASASAYPGVGRRPWWSVLRVGGGRRVRDGAGDHAVGDGGRDGFVGGRHR